MIAGLFCCFLMSESFIFFVIVIYRILNLFRIFIPENDYNINKVVFTDLGTKNHVGMVLVLNLFFFIV